MKDGVPERKYDYSQDGVYFVTVCTQNRACILGTVVGRGDLTPPVVRLSRIGKIVDRYTTTISTAHAQVNVDKYAIMPNHVHLLLRICTPKDGGVGSPRPTVAEVIRGWKSLITRTVGHSIWQTSFYDHIIRSPDDYNTVWHYIDTNPANGRRIHFTSRTFLIRCGGPPAAPTKR